MGSRKYEKATTLPTLPSANQISSPNYTSHTQGYRTSSKTSLGNTVLSPSTAPSPIVGGGFWGRSSSARSHPPSSTFQDFDDSVSDAWDIRDDKGFGCGTGSVIDVEPTSVSPFLTKQISTGPGVHYSSANKEISSQLSAKSDVSSSTVPVTKPVEESTNLVNVNQVQGYLQEETSTKSKSNSMLQEQSNSVSLNSSIETKAVRNITTLPSSSTTISSASSSQSTIAFASNSPEIKGGAGSADYNGRTAASKENTVILSGENKRYAKLELMINESPSFELEELRKLAWSGISAIARAKAWKILCGYLPPPGTAAIRYVFRICCSNSIMQAQFVFSIFQVGE